MTPSIILNSGYLQQIPTFRECTLYYYTDRGKTYFPLKLQTTKNSQKTKRICKNCGKLNKNSIVKYEPLMVRLWE